MRLCAFTLIELLVVVGIIGLLAGLLLPAISTMMAKSEISAAKTDLQRIVMAWENYSREYGRWPVEGNPSQLFGSGVNASEDGEGMEMVVMVRTNIMYPGSESTAFNKHPICTKYNPKRIPFMTYNKDSLNEDGDMVDPWGSPYRFMFDLDRDGKVEVGGTLSTTVYASVVAWSVGPLNGAGEPVGQPLTSWE
jgi:prepilin-type N-terminal cleavage/methylation domain-containing protein